jgi:hypothetical protein
MPHFSFHAHIRVFHADMVIVIGAIHGARSDAFQPRLDKRQQQHYAKTTANTTYV